MAPHSSTLAWKIPWTEEPGRLQSMGSRRVGHDWVTSLSLSTFMHWRRKWQQTPVFLPGESQGQRSLVAAIYGVAQSRTRLKGLSSNSSSSPYEMLYGRPFVHVNDLLLDPEAQTQRLIPWPWGNSKRYMLWAVNWDPQDSKEPPLYAPRTQVLIKVWKDESPKAQLQPTWKGPYSVILSTPIAVKV